MTVMGFVCCTHNLEMVTNYQWRQFSMATSYSVGQLGNDVNMFFLPTDGKTMLARSSNS